MYSWTEFVFTVVILAGTESPPLDRSEAKGSALEKELYR
jgi:hypothetical protein